MHAQMEYFRFFVWGKWNSFELEHQLTMNHVSMHHGKLVKAIDEFTRPL